MTRLGKQRCRWVLVSLVILTVVTAHRQLARATVVTVNPAGSHTAKSKSQHASVLLSWTACGSNTPVHVPVLTVCDCNLENTWEVGRKSFHGLVNWRSFRPRIRIFEPSSKTESQNTAASFTGVNSFGGFLHAYSSTAPPHHIHWLPWSFIHFKSIEALALS